MKKKNKSVKQDLLGFVLVIFLALLFRSIAYEAYYIPSESMLPNLLIGDRIVINKYKYGISNYSFPLSPQLFNGRILELDQPKRGDVIVFETDMIYIKRLIGLPGDTVQVLDGIIYINGSQVPRISDGYFHNENQSSEQYLQKLPNGVIYKVLEDGNTLFDDTGEYKIPENHYFFIGDNMDHSNDSRNINGIYYVPKQNIVGKAEVVLFSSKYSMYNVINFLKNIRKNRFLKKIT